MAQTSQESVWTVDESPSILSYTLANFRKLPQLEQFTEEQIFDMEVVGNAVSYTHLTLPTTPYV